MGFERCISLLMYSISKAEKVVST